MRGRKRVGTAASRGKAKTGVLAPEPLAKPVSAAENSILPPNTVLPAEPPAEPLAKQHIDQNTPQISPPENPLSLSSSVSLESIPTERKTPRKRTSSRKQIQPTYVPREDTKKVIQERLAKCAAWEGLPEDTKENIVRRLERACYNCVIDQCSELYIEKSWDQMEFVNRYSSVVYKLISNIDLSREYHANSPEPSSFGDKIIRGEINVLIAPLMSSYEMFPEATQKERDILDFRAGQKVQKKFTTRYGCPKCGQHKAEPKEVQTAANDEISRFNLLCLICSHTWFQK